MAVSDVKEYAHLTEAQVEGRPIVTRAIARACAGTALAPTPRQEH